MLSKPFTSARSSTSRQWENELLKRGIVDAGGTRSRRHRAGRTTPPPPGRDGSWLRSRVRRSLGRLEHRIPVRAGQMHPQRIGPLTDARDALRAEDGDHAGRDGRAERPTRLPRGRRPAARQARREFRAARQDPRPPARPAPRRPRGRADLPRAGSRRAESRASAGIDREGRRAAAPAPSKKLGLVGCDGKGQEALEGMMGCEHIRNLKIVPGVRITAIADPDERSRGLGKLAAGGECRRIQGLPRAPRCARPSTPS